MLGLGLVFVGDFERILVRVLVLESFCVGGELDWDIMGYSLEWLVIE